MKAIATALRKGERNGKKDACWQENRFLAEIQIRSDVHDVRHIDALGSYSKEGEMPMLKRGIVREKRQE